MDLLNSTLASMADVCPPTTQPPTQPQTQPPTQPPTPEEQPTPPPQPPTTTQQNLEQFTPDYRSTIYEHNGGKHDPDSWLKKERWGEPWNGVPIDTTNMSKEELCKALFNDPCNDCKRPMLGLRELYYNTKPFKDEFNPTAPEIDNWNIQVVRHFRRLIGSNVPAELDNCLFLKSQWAAEKKFTDYWGEKCTTGPHCGWGFVPNPEEQLPYLNRSEPCAQKRSSTEGIFGTGTPVNWSTVLSNAIGYSLCNEGLTGHTGPFVSRTKFGFSFVGGSLIVQTD